MSMYTLPSFTVFLELLKVGGIDVANTISSIFPH